MWLRSQALWCLSSHELRTPCTEAPGSKREQQKSFTSTFQLSDRAQADLCSAQAIRGEEQIIIDTAQADEQGHLHVHGSQRTYYASHAKSLR